MNSNSKTNLKTILHLSDLHFGSVQDHLIERLLDFLQASDREKIDLVVISGDLTQRARSKQFIAASEFLKKISVPIVAVPGNHDVPLYDLINRFIRPFARYNKYIHKMAPHTYEDEAIVVQGIRTNNILKVMSGKVSTADVVILEKTFQESAQKKLKVLVAHHPIFKIAKKHLKIWDLLGRVLNLKPDIVLFGHEHKTEIVWYGETGRSPLLIAAGTGTSNRIRGETNAFNLITWHSEKRKIDIAVYNFNDESRQFHLTKTEEFQLG